MRAETLLNKLDRRRVVYPAVAVLLGSFFVLAVTSVRDKCASSDEVVHLLAGASYWKLGDYRIDPENGNLPQRWMALPLLGGHLALPSFNDYFHLNEWPLAQLFFYELGNDPDAMLLAGRLMIALVAAGLGVLVYAWSSRLFGRGGGLISAVLYCFSTAVLANGHLATSDVTAALCFLASVGCLWRMLHRFTPWTVLGSAAVMGLLFVSKMSAMLVVPMGVLLIAIRLICPEALAVACGRFRRQVASRLGQLGLFVGATVVHAAVVVLVIWAFYGFRYSAIRPDLAGREQFDAEWQRILSEPFPLQGPIVFACDHRLLPEGFLHGLGYVLHFAHGRWAFAAGQYSFYGWWWFFPYCFLIKTPLSLFVVLILAVVAAVMGWRRGAVGGARPMKSALWEGFYRTAPLWVLLAVYWATAIISKINIGHRHILVTYPAMFILAGSTISLFRRGWLSQLGWVLGLSLVAYVGEGLWTWPNYLAYFNQLVGGPRYGYRQLVDSSLDWGQDLPGLKRWLDRQGLSDPSSPTPVYLSYFGTGSPTYYRIRAQRLQGFVDADLWDSRPVVGVLTGGVYCVSASMLPMVLIEPRGNWSAFYEGQYRLARAWFDEFIALPPEVQREKIRTQAQQITQYVTAYDALRFGRLMAYLRHRPVDDEVGGSILIYRLSEEEVRRALDPNRPPAEMTDDQVPLWMKLGLR
ncbi:MAG: glycosyltransferase family 39 protein [Phycisphaerae bacterium]|nr:glycosyltransferase family 39 protein [Phycisphaerae bacterium]